jgi:hypothetical protein
MPLRFQPPPHFVTAITGPAPADRPSPPFRPGRRLAVAAPSIQRVHYADASADDRVREWPGTAGFAVGAGA